MRITHDIKKGTTINFPTEESDHAIMFLIVMAEGFRQMDKIENTQKIIEATRKIEAIEQSPTKTDS